MNNIVIVNLRKTRNCTRVDRATVLGNPFVMSATQSRDQVCDLYITHLGESYRNIGSPIHNAINALVTRYDNGEKLVLGCWCAPERCHAESIRDLIYSLCEQTQLEEQQYVAWEEMEEAHFS